MAADRGDRSHDEQGGFAPSDGDEETTEREEGPVNKPTAPSIGPKTVIDRPPPEERLSKHDQSPVDAMGLDKRRQIVGGDYGPSKTKQAALYGGFVVVVAVLVFGFITVVDRLDEPSEVHRSEAPWAQPAAPQVEPAPLDQPRNGSPDSGL